MRKLKRIALFFLLALSFISAANAQEDFVITVGENKVFTECNYHDTLIQSNPAPELASVGNTAYVHALANVPAPVWDPDRGRWICNPEYEERVGYALVGVNYTWNWKDYSGDGSEPVKVTMNFTYQANFKSPTPVEGVGYGVGFALIQLMPAGWPSFNPSPEPTTGYYEIMGTDESLGIYEGQKGGNASVSATTTIDELSSLGTIGAFIQAGASSRCGAPLASYGNVDITINSITIEFPTINQAPVASFNYSPQNPQVNQEITFDASSSSDSDGTLASYEWSFGDGATSQGVIATHTYAQAGNYTVTLTVTDDKGLTDTTNSSLAVTAAPVETPLDKQASQKDVITVGEPINVANGNMFTLSSDISIPSSTIPLELSRTYNSQDDFNGSFGYGWRSNFDITLTEQPDASVIEVDETGVYTIYTKNPDNSYSASAGKYSQLTKNPDGSYQILRKHGAKLYFNAQGLLTRIEDRNANAITILRSSNGVIQEVTDSSGRRLQFSADSQGKITQVTDPKGRLFKYEYDSNGNLIKTTDPLDNKTTYLYDSSHNLTQLTDSNNHSLYFEYDASDKAYHSWQDNNNNEVSLVFDPANKTTTSTDSLGNVTTYEYNDYGLVTKITDAQGNTQTFIWDGQLNKTSSTNQNGATASFTYDARGNLLTVTDALTNITTFTYETSFDFVNSKTDALGNRTEYSYDVKGNFIQTKDALNNIANYTYSQGLLTQILDANNNLTLFDYDPFGNLTQITDTQNNKTLFSYDILGNKTQTTDAQGNVTSFTYDLLNRLIQITYADNSKVTYSYDPVGNLISSVDQNNNTTSYAYDAVDRLTQVTDAQGNTTAYTYDTEGNRTSITDAAGNTTQYSYDSLNRLVVSQDPIGNQTLFSYDPVGNNITVTDANSNITSYEFDALNRLTKATDANNNITQYEYDKIGNRLSITDAKGNLTSYVYDALSRLIKTSFPDASFETYSYDSLSNPTQKITRKGDAINFSYDSLNRLTTKSYPDSSGVAYTYDSLSRLITATDSAGVITHAYDSLGRLTSVTYPNVFVVSYQYDAAGNRTKLTYPDATYLTYTYDSLNRLTSIKDQFATAVATFSYDNLSRRTNLALANGVTTSYAYDPLSRLLSLSNQKALSTISSFNYAYDAVGNRLSMATPKGSFNYTYDNIYELATVQKPSLATANYSFDPLGNRIELANASTLSYTSNSLNQYTQITNGSVTTNLAYDLNGNLISKLGIRQSGRPVRKATSAFDYDYENRLNKVVRGKLTVTFTYDAFGRRTSKKVNKTAPVNYIYDGDNIILDLDTTNKIIAKYIYGPDTDEPLVMIKGAKKYYYSKDGLGSVVNLTNASGKLVESYTYDEYGKSLNSSSIANRYLFTGREYDRETGLYYYRARYYDPAMGRFLQADPIGYAGGMNLYAYTKNNPINYVDPWGLKAYSEEETEKIKQEAVKDAGTSIKDYFTKPPDIFGGGGKYDYLVNEPTSTFKVKGETMNAGQFGNYLAGYATVRNYGYWGYYGTRLGGHVYAIAGATEELRQGRKPEYILDNPESIKYIDKGTVDALIDSINKKRCQGTKKERYK